MNIIYKEREIEGERLELADKDGLYYLGPDLALRRCTGVLRVPARRLLISPSRFIDCTLDTLTPSLSWWERGGAHERGLQRRRGTTAPR